MIRLDNIGKQNGKQLLIASAALQKGRFTRRSQRGRQDAVPDDHGEEQPDEARWPSIAASPSATPARTWADVSRSAVSEVMEGAGR
jgi:hypothetical protein